MDVLNYGDATAPGVTASLSTIDPYISILYGSCDFGDIGPGVEASDGETFLISVSKEAPNRHEIYLTFQMEDAKGNAWDESVMMTVSQPDFCLHTFSAPDIIGNGDGNPDRGETCYLILSLKNLGLRPAEAVTATISTSCADVVIFNQTSVITDIPMDSVGDNHESPFIFYIKGNTTDHVISFEVHLSEGNGFCQTEMPLHVLMNQNKILMVADDGSFSNSGYYTDVLNELGVPYRHWSVVDEGEVPADTILDFDEVIWFTGREASNTLTEQDRDALSLFLDNGGHLLLSGSMIGVYIGNTDFHSQYLHARYVFFMTELHNLKGAKGNPISDGMYISLADQGSNEQGFCGEIDPLPPAFGIFEYDQTTDEGPGRIQSSGMGAIAVETDDFKVAYFSFGLEGIEPFESRYDVFEALFDWFRGRPIDVRARLGFVDCGIDDDVEGASSGDGDGYPNPGEEIEMDISVVNSGLLTGENIIGSIRAEDEFITITDSTANFGNVDPGSVVVSSDAFVVRIAEGTPSGHTVAFEMMLTDTPGNCWTDTFGLAIYLTSTVTGRVTDVGTGLGIPEATLHWMGFFNEVTGVYDQVGFATADDEGNYAVSLVNGQYWIRAEAPGFLPSYWHGLHFPPDTSDFDFALTSPRMEYDPESFSVRLSSGETRESTLEIRNTYTGQLHYAFLEMEPSLKIGLTPDHCVSFDPLVHIDLDSLPKPPQSFVQTEDASPPDPERWRLIYIDADEPDNALDFERFYAQNDDRDLYFKIKAREPWSNPRDDFYLYIWMDTDMNKKTGAEIMELGVEYCIVCGMNSYLIYWRENWQEFDIHSYLPYMQLPPHADSLEVGIHLADIEEPRRVNLAFMFINVQGDVVDDQAPDGGLGYIPYSTYDAGWLSVQPSFGLVHEGQSKQVMLSIDALGLLPGEYNLNLVVENNQPQRGPVVVPVRLTVGETSVDGESNTILPTEFALAQNFPNPFNPTTTIYYAIPSTGQRGQSREQRAKNGEEGADSEPYALRTTLKIYNILGQEVRTLVDEPENAGYYTIGWDGKNGSGIPVPSGVYFYQLTSGNFSQTKKMLLMK